MRLNSNTTKPEFLTLHNGRSGAAKGVQHRGSGSEVKPLHVLPNKVRRVGENEAIPVVRRSVACLQSVGLPARTEAWWWNGNIKRRQHCGVYRRMFAWIQLCFQNDYANHHLQTILFEISRQIVARLTDPQEEKRAKFRYQARHELFPQVMGIVEAFAETRVDWSGATDRRELGLQIYADQVLERLCDAIEPDEASGEPPLLPVINRFRPHGSTSEVIFNTTRPCHPTQRSHIDNVVLDTLTWERSASFTLEASKVVNFYARNDDGASPSEETSHLDFGIPYEMLGVSHIFYPDFLVRLLNGVTVILEIKGMLGEREEAKFQAAHRWVSAVNNWGRMGKWAFHVCRDPQMLGRELEYLATAAR